MSGGVVRVDLDPEDFFVLDFEAYGGIYVLTVHRIYWHPGGGVILDGEARKRLARGGLGVLRPGACDLGGTGFDGLEPEARAVVLAHRPPGWPFGSEADDNA